MGCSVLSSADVETWSWRAGSASTREKQTGALWASYGSLFPRNYSLPISLSLSGLAFDQTDGPKLLSMHSMFSYFNELLLLRLLLTGWKV